ncbi:TIGR03943 family protein [Paenibacillus sp. V4I7]|uniref:TIGR03943 family putative permease subunit n=1 Tax=Paenibacillus sp. V4I7 TaxID=3042307 RepID=UPI0027D807E8|nr:TIGR03943 family protein [Paenibacillus sp. V4I7]
MKSNLAAKKGVSLTGNVNQKATALTASNKTDSVSVSIDTVTPGSPTPAPSVIASTEQTAPSLKAADSNKLPTSTVSDPLDTLFPHDEYSEDLAKLGKKLYKKDFISIGEKGFMEIISSMDFYMENFMGKKVDISGFVYRENDMKEDQFVVSRFAVQCCSADAAPYGLMVESAAGKELKKDTWVKITGILEKTNYNGNEIMKIHASKIEKIPAPNSPYTYPDFDYFEKSS